MSGSDKATASLWEVFSSVPDHRRAQGKRYPLAGLLMIALAASCSYLTPLEPACLLVYGPGRYRFLDFLRVGALPTVLIYALCILLVPVFWPV